MDLYLLSKLIAHLLQCEGRVSYRTLREGLGLDDATIEALRYELVDIKGVAADDRAVALAWVGSAATGTPEGARNDGSVGEAALEAEARRASDIPASVEERQPGRAAGGDTRDTQTLEDAQRRQLTVMFCDLVGSTALSTKLDPEDLREVITGFQDACRRAVEQYDGFIARYMGDGMLVYFGYPQAHEHDAERAVRAGLELVGSMAQLNAGVAAAHGVSLAVRVGIATGAVVVGDIIGEGAAEEAAVVGETPNLAARLQAVAAPDQVVVGSVTQRLVAESFDCEDLGMHELKGLAEPVQVWAVTRERDTTAESNTERGGGTLPLIGRQEELGLLIRSWEASKGKHGQVVLIQGEAGIGKSRLIEALRERVSGEEYLWIAHRCSPYHTNSTLFPVIEHMKRVMGLQPDDDAVTKLAKLEAALQAQSLPPQEAVPLYAGLLSVPLPESRYAPLGLTPQQRREQTLDALAAWLLEEAERRPVLQVWEDLHWADPTTLELLELYIEQSPTVSMLNVLTYRPEFVPPWSMHSHMTPITLNRLERPEVEALIAHRARGKTLPDEVVEHIAGKADGVPLFVEELTKTILESDYLHEEEDRYSLAGPLSEVAIPATLQDTLMARLDRFPTVREVAQLGAVVGREFAYEMLRSLASVEETVLQAGLGRLVENELLYQRGRPPRSRYIFKHALIQDAAYQSLLRRTRQQVHQQVATLLESRFPETVTAHPELVANHYSEAGCHEQAVGYWSAAGRRAAERSADEESIAHLRHGLQSLSSLPDTPERAHTELELLTSLGPALISSKGYGAQEVKETYARAKVLCDRVGTKADRFAVMRGLWNSYLFAAEMPEARRRSEELLHLAREMEDAALVAEAHRVMGTVCFMMGDFADARRHTEHGIEAYDRERHGGLALVYGADPAVVCRLYGAKASWMLGYPDQAQSLMDAALRMAHEISHGHTEAFAWCYQAALHQYSGDVAAARESARKAVDLAHEHNIRQWLAWGTILWGWALFFGGEKETGLKELREGLDSWRKSDLFAYPYLLGLKAEIQSARGDTDAGIDTLKEAIRLSMQQNQLFYLSELNRSTGTLLMQKGCAAEAETYFERALKVACQQDAKSPQLRAATSLFELWQAHGRAERAPALLRESCDWFSEGHDTAFVQRARTLLDSRPLTPAPIS